MFVLLLSFGKYAMLAKVSKELKLRATEDFYEGGPYRNAFRDKFLWTQRVLLFLANCRSYIA